MDRRWKASADALVWERSYDDLFAPNDRGGQWCVGGQLNACHNLVDRHLDDHADQPALHWEGEPGDRRTLTYADLHADVLAVTEGLAGLGVGIGDRVALYTGLIPEAIATMLACMRLGATYAVLPSVLPPEALAARIDDLSPRVLVTQDGAWRHGVVLPMKARADEALAASGSVDHTLVIRRTGVDVPWFEGDRWFHELLAGPRLGPDAEPRAPFAPVAVPSDHPLHVTYHANRKGQPAGVVHGTAGLLLHCHATQRAIAPDGDAVMWAPAEFAWLGTQSQGIIGPLLNGATAVVYEGMLDTPRRDRAWQVIDRYGVTALMATPSVLRAVRRWGGSPPTPHQVATLQLVLTVGEAIEPETESWLDEVFGHGKVSIVNLWGQTELGGIAYTAAPTIADRLPDAGLQILSSTGRQAELDEVGDLVLTQPWAGRTLGIWGRDDVPGASSNHPEVFVTGDRARRTGHGIEFLGRSDRVFSVSGQLVAATEVEDVLGEHPFVESAIVIDRHDQVTGRAVVACIVLAAEIEPSLDLAGELRSHVRETLGGLSQPQLVLFLGGLPTDADVTDIRAALSRLATSSEPMDQISQRSLEDAITATAP